MGGICPLEVTRCGSRQFFEGGLWHLVESYGQMPSTTLLSMSIFRLILTLSMYWKQRMSLRCKPGSILSSPVWETTRQRRAQTAVKPCECSEGGEGTRVGGREGRERGILTAVKPCEFLYSLVVCVIIWLCQTTVDHCSLTNTYFDYLEYMVWA